MSSIQSSSFLSFLSFLGPVLKKINDTQKFVQTSNMNIDQNETNMATLKALLAHNREELIENSIKYAKEIFYDFVIEAERRVRKKRSMAGKNSNDVELTFEAEMERDLYASINSVTQEIKDRFEQLHFLAKSMISSFQSI